MEAVPGLETPAPVRRRPSGVKPYATVGYSCGHVVRWPIELRALPGLTQELEGIAEGEVCPLCRS